LPKNVCKVAKTQRYSQGQPILLDNGSGDAAHEGIKEPIGTITSPFSKELVTYPKHSQCLFSGYGSGMPGGNGQIKGSLRSLCEFSSRVIRMVAAHQKYFGQPRLIA
jgi:hypothetical protein